MAQLFNQRLIIPPGGVVPSTEDVFPLFADGDVLIVITPSRRYRLHSTILRRSSPTFAALLEEQAAIELSKNAKKKGVTTRYRLHLVENEYAGAREAGVHAATHVLIRIPLDEGGAALGDYPDLLGDANENGRVVPQYVLAWEQVLGSFYNRPIGISDDSRDGVDYMLDSAGCILNAAEYLGMPMMVTRPIEAAVLSIGQVLYRSMATNPAPWLDFSYRIRSKALWKEALIHGAGRYNSPPIQSALHNADLRPSIVALLTEKANLLKTLSQAIQSNLLSYYPESLQRTKTVGRADRDSIGRASYANDIMQWLGLTVWRHWLAQQVCADRTHHAADMGFEFFRAIGRAGEAYLDRNQLRQFHEYFPMSVKGESVMENRISELKQDGQGMVKKALENHSYLDTATYPAQHMTCTWVGPEDYPWEREAEEERRRAGALSETMSVEEGYGFGFGGGDYGASVGDTEMDAQSAMGGV